VRVVVDTPTSLSTEESELVRTLAKLRGDDVAPDEKGFFSKIRSAFK
jgi:DnaJ-class molecular chaperone